MGRISARRYLCACVAMLAFGTSSAGTKHCQNDEITITMTPTVLVERIATTFPSVPMPERVAEEGAYDSDDINREFRRYRDGLIGDQVFFDNRTALPVLSLEGFQALFPGYLRYVVNNPASDVSDYLASFLSGESPKLVTDARLATMNRPQINLLCTLLDWVAQKVEASEPQLAKSLRDSRMRVVAAAAPN